LRISQKIGFSAAHIAAYSPRPQTAARLFKDQIPHQEKQKRVEKLTEVLRQTALEHNQRYLHQVISVLIKTKSPKNFLLGRSFSDTTVKILNNNNQDLIGKKVMVKINKVGPWQLEGKILNHS
jgi:tRNA-2-methylthio-N6-dimethylallyladenosine synthase